MLTVVSRAWWQYPCGSNCVRSDLLALGEPEPGGGRHMGRAVTKLVWVGVAAASWLLAGCASEDPTGPNGPPDSGCEPDNDGVISMLEMNAVAGVSGRFLRARSVSVDTAGTIASGQRVWDFTGPYQGDEVITSTLEPIAGKWFASDFPTATYLWMIGDVELYGVYRVTADSVLLLGYASPTGDPQESTVTTYEPPLVVFRTPMTEGDRWETTASLTGSSPFGPVQFTDRYAAHVDARGTMISPAGQLAVLRVNILASRDDATSVESHRQQYYLAECRGIVGAVVSESSELDEPEPDFSTAEEIARLAE